MDIAPSETQQMLRDAMREYLRQEVPIARVRELERDGAWDEDLWAYLQNAGYLALALPENFGGSGGELTDLAVVLEELTRQAVPIPFMETMLCAVTIARYASDELAREVVNSVTAGTTTLAPAVLEESDRFDDISATVRDGKLTGSKRFVDYGHVVTHHLVVAKEGNTIGLYLVSANAPEVTAHPLQNIARTPQANINYQGVDARKAAGEEAFRFLLQLARALAAIQCLGNAQEALDKTIEYAQIRVVFGRPIGTFQAVKHHCANMATMTLATRFLAYEAVWQLDHGLATDQSIAAAKAWASKTATEVPMQAHQLHGGIGVTEEYDLHFYSRHGKERALAWGTFDECVAQVAGTIEEAEGWQ